MSSYRRFFAHPAMQNESEASMEPAMQPAMQPAMAKEPKAPVAKFVALYTARDILNVDSNVLVNFRLNMHVLHNCTNCGYCPTSSMSVLRKGILSMTEVLVCYKGRAKVFITSCSDADCLAACNANAEIVKALVK
jgi:ferredoxin